MIPGVYRTRVGYAGGTTPSPTYRSMGDHTEALQIDFDPRQIDFSELATMFWEGHNPVQSPSYRQYMSAIWFHNEGQHKVLQATREIVASMLSGPVRTPVEAFDGFTLAEDYHQKYRLQSRNVLMSWLRGIYPEFEVFNDSTVAARLNGWLSGVGSKAQLQQELESYSLGPVELQELRPLL